MSSQPPPPLDPQPRCPLLDLEPVVTLLSRLGGELPTLLDSARPIRISRAPGRLDVMGGIADYTGSLVCEMPLDRAAAVAIQERRDDQVQVFSFNLLDEHRPFTWRAPIAALLDQPIDALRDDFDESGRKWAGYLAGCLSILHEELGIDRRVGLNIALYSTVPSGAGVSSSAAIEVATMMNLIDHFALRERVDPMKIAAMCQRVENQIVGAPCGIMDQVTSCTAHPGMLLRLLCQPDELQPNLKVPTGMRFIGINSNVSHSVGGGQYGITRCAAFMAHKIILETMRQIGQAAGRELAADPMNGYLANLDADDYKRMFRPRLPEFMKGADFLTRYDATIDTATTVQPGVLYPVQHAADHHVLENRRVRNFIEYLEEAEKTTDPRERGGLLDHAGHLMYASHLSYTNDAMLGADECDLLVNLVRGRERAGLYGAKITGGGSGGTVAVLMEDEDRSRRAINDIVQEYRKQTGKTADVFDGTSPGAWVVGTVLVGSERGSGTCPK